MTLSLFLQVVWMFLFPLASVLIPTILGQRYAIYLGKAKTEVHKDVIGSVVAASLGLLAFMLAFTFQIAANRFQERKNLLLEETQVIRSAYLRSSLIPEPYNSNTKRKLVEYVDLRVALLKDPTKLSDAISRSQVILDSLWMYTQRLAEQDRSSEVYALYTTGINDLVHTYNQRITMALVFRIPPPILVVLFIILFLSMFILGYQFGIAGKGGLMVVALLAVTFSVVMFLIFALDRPDTGLIPINSKPIVTLQQQLQGKYFTVE